MTAIVDSPATRRHVLVIAYHYPPVAGSSGVQRTLKFTSYLRDFGWDASVLTVHPRAYERTSDDQMADIPAGMRVERAFALDSARHLSIRGRFPRRFAMPDRWFTWWPGAILRGLRMIRQDRPSVLMSTFPIATAHAVGCTLQRLSGIPWVADFRDNMTDEVYPADPVVWRYNRKLEERTVHRCGRAVFTTRGALRMYAERYPGVAPSRWAVIENGFDEENFREAAAAAASATASPRSGPLRLVHSGILYPEERDPRAFFAAVASLKQSGAISADQVRIVLRATASDHLYQPMLQALAIHDIVELAPLLGYRAALAEMMSADGLLLFQAAMANHQIPAKLYEYMRAGRPILALTDRTGDSAEALRATGYGHVCQLDDAEDIREKLLAFVQGLAGGTIEGTPAEVAAQHSRRARTKQLASLLDEVRTSQP